MIVQAVSISSFRDAFRIRPNSFSYEGLEVLFDYLEEVSDDTGEPVELDVIAICCEYEEDTAESIAASCDVDLPERDDWMDDEDYSEAVRDEVREYLERNTTVCGETDDTFIYASF